MRLKVLLFVIFCTLFIDSFSQKKENFSIETDINYYYYYLGNNTKNPFNYGFSFLGSYIVNKLKVSSGINFSTQDSHYNVIPDASSNFLEKRDYNIKHINFPVLVYYAVYSSRKYKTAILGGVVFNRVIGYDITSYYSNRDPIIEKNIEINNQKTGVSVRLGIGISRYINQHLLITLSPFTDLKIETEQVEYRPNYHSLPSYRLSHGLKLGIGYILD
jgi:hypothetical protein